MSNKGISIVIPAFNEEKSIGKVIEEIKTIMETTSYQFEIIVIDDGSTDKTYEIVSQKECKVIRHKRNKGYGFSLKDGIKASKYEYIVITDGDGTYPNKEIPNLIKELEDYDMVVGARIGSDVHIPLIRKPAKWILGKIASILIDYNIPDLNSGLRAFKKDIVLKYFNILPSGFSFTTTITLAFHCDGFEVLYLPINYAKREGKSKIKPIQDTLNFLQLIFRTVIYFNPLKVFLPISLFLFSTGVFIAILQALLKHNITTTADLLILTGLQIGSIGLIADLIVQKNKRI